MADASWQDVGAQFRKGASEHPEVWAQWDGQNELWILRDGSPQSEQLFTQTAQLAVRLLQSSSDHDVQTRTNSLRKLWHVWLDLMRDNQRGFQWKTRRRRRASGTPAEYRGQLSALIGLSVSGIPHVFQESADFCADLDREGETKDVNDSGQRPQPAPISAALDQPRSSDNAPELSKEQIAALRRETRRQRARRAALELATAPRLAAEAEMRKESANAVQQHWPRDADHLEQVLWPSLRNQSEKVFDAIAEAKLKSLGFRFSTRRYVHWLRCTCIPAVVDDVGHAVRLYETAKHIFDVIGDARWPAGIDETRRALARLMTELAGGPHAESLEKRVEALLMARIAHWEAAAIEKQPVIDSVHRSKSDEYVPQELTQDETDLVAPDSIPPSFVSPRAGAGTADRADEVNAPGAMVTGLSRRELVDTFLSRCNEVSTARIGRAHIWRTVGHRHARQFEYWQAGEDRLAGTTRGATKQDNQNFLRILAMNPEDFVAELRKSGTIPAKS